MKQPSEVIFETLPWLEEKLKKAKADLAEATKDCSAMGYFEDCGEFYQRAKAEAQTRFDTLLEIKVGMEKYAKKLRHQETENE